MTTDKQIHLLFKACPEFLYELANLPFPGPCRVESVEVKALARTADSVVTPLDEREPMLVAEIQAQKVPTIYQRIVIEMAQLQMDHGGRDIFGLILFGRRSLDLKTRPWNQIVRAIYLDEALHRLQKANPNHPLVAAFSPMFIKQETALEKDAARQYQLIIRSKLGKKAEQVLEQIFTHWLCERLKHRTQKEIAMILNLPDIHQTRAGQELLAEGLQKGIAKGRQEGRQEGREEGREEAMIESIFTVGTKHFGAPPAGLQKQLAGLRLNQLSETLAVVLDSPNWKSVTTWVKSCQKR